MSSIYRTSDNSSVINTALNAAVVQISATKSITGILFSPPAIDYLATVGTVVATATATYGGTGASATIWSLTNSASGKYTINSTTGLVTVASALVIETDTITIYADDGFGRNFTQSFSIVVQHSPPTAITLSNQLIYNTTAAGSVVGSITVTDADGFSGTLSFTSNPGSLFSLSGANLVLVGSLAVGTYPITIQASELGVNLSQSFTITCNNISSAPTLAIATVNETTATSKTNEIVSFGHQFADGDILPNFMPVLYIGSTVVATQSMDNEVHWPSGCLRRCNFDCIVPTLASSGTVSLAIKALIQAQDHTSGNALALSAFQTWAASNSWNVEWDISIDGIAYKADALSALAKGTSNYGIFKQTPNTIEYIAWLPFFQVSSPTTNHPILVGRFEIKVIRSSGTIQNVRTIAHLENGTITSTSNAAYLLEYVQLKQNGTIVWQRALDATPTPTLTFDSKCWANTDGNGNYFNCTASSNYFASTMVGQPLDMNGTWAKIVGYTSPTSVKVTQPIYNNYAFSAPQPVASTIALNYSNFQGGASNTCYSAAIGMRAISINTPVLFPTVAVNNNPTLTLSATSGSGVTAALSSDSFFTSAIIGSTISYLNGRAVVTAVPTSSTLVLNVTNPFSTTALPMYNTYCDSDFSATTFTFHGTTTDGTNTESFVGPAGLNPVITLSKTATPAIALTLSAVSGNPINVTAGSAYFQAGMAGATITGFSGSGVIIAVTDSTHATMQVTSTFSTTSLTSGNWTINASSVVNSTIVYGGTGLIYDQLFLNTDTPGVILDCTITSGAVTAVTIVNGGSNVGNTPIVLPQRITHGSKNWLTLTSCTSSGASVGLMAVGGNGLRHARSTGYTTGNWRLCGELIPPRTRLSKYTWHTNKASNRVTYDRTYGVKSCAIQGYVWSEINTQAILTKATYTNLQATFANTGQSAYMPDSTDCPPFVYVNGNSWNIPLDEGQTGGRPDIGINNAIEVVFWNDQTTSSHRMVLDLAYFSSQAWPVLYRSDTTNVANDLGSYSAWFDPRSNSTFTIDHDYWALVQLDAAHQSNRALRSAYLFTGDFMFLESLGFTAVYYLTSSGGSDTNMSGYPSAYTTNTYYRLPAGQQRQTAWCLRSLSHSIDGFPDTLYTTNHIVAKTVLQSSLNAWFDILNYGYVTNGPDPTNRFPISGYGSRGDWHWCASSGANVGASNWQNYYTLLSEGFCAQQQLLSANGLNFCAWHADYVMNMYSKTGECNSRYIAASYYFPTGGILNPLQTITLAATSGNGIAVTASAPIFVSTMVNGGFTGLGGIATFISITDSTHATVNISSTFSGTVMTSGQWVLNYQWQGLAEFYSFLQAHPDQAVANQTYSGTPVSTITLGATSGSSVTVTASTATFFSDHVGSNIWAAVYNGSSINYGTGQAVITAVNSSTSITVNILSTFGASSYTPNTWILGMPNPGANVGSFRLDLTQGIQELDYVALFYGAFGAISYLPSRSAAATAAQDVIITWLKFDALAYNGGVDGTLSAKNGSNPIYTIQHLVGHK